MKRILIVEDDWELNTGLAYMLEKESFEVASAYSVREGKERYRDGGADLVLLDVNLPDGEGFSFCQWMRTMGKVPVLFLTARDLEEDVLTGYELGAEDYVTKPFSMKILLKKIDVILKRTKENTGAAFDDGFLIVDLEKAQVRKGGAKGEELSVTPTEFRILREFLSHPGQLMTYEVLLERLWDLGNQFVDKHALAVNIGRLRGKIEDEEHKYISNVYGMGYQWIG